MIEPRELTFEALRHAYTYDGQPIPSVTQVLKDMGLTDYSMISQDVLQAAARRGTDAHLACQLDDEGDLDESTVSDAIRPYLEAYRRFRRETGFVPDLIEARGYDPALRVAGTLDRTGTLNGKPVLLDLKTGILLPGHALQITAYTRFLDKPRLYVRYALRLKDDRTYHLTLFPIESYARDLQTWQMAACLWHWRNNNKLIRTASEELQYA